MGPAAWNSTPNLRLRVALSLKTASLSALITAIGQGARAQNAVAHEAEAENAVETTRRCFFADLSRDADSDSDEERRRRRKERKKKDKEERRSVLTGKKIKLKVKKDREGDANRAELLAFLNNSM
uniref:Uncharacterized protein n=1 Tax=Mycena chlorophos TaxID=658473 RepID=A0ABQ0M313_MYCCL|nr:predicted protein [Mycena chlorophos]